MLKIIAAIVLFAFLGSASSFAADLPEDLQNAAKQWDRAQYQGDGAALRRLLADDYTLVNSHGTVMSKAQYIAETTAPGFKLEPFVVTEPIVKVWKDGAVRGGLVRASFTEGGKQFHRQFRFADVWIKRGGRWQIIYTAVTRVERSAP